MTTESGNTKSITVFLSGGQITPGKMAGVVSIAERFNLKLYFTTQQNLRLIGASEENLEEIKKELIESGLTLRASIKFPMPRVCVGVPYCNLGIADTFSLADKIRDRYANRTDVMPKFKIAISGCPACCGGSKLADIGVVGTRNGYELNVGGKGGPLPRTGVRSAKGLSEDEVVEAIGQLADFHAANTPKKQRMFKLIDKETFPTFTGK